MDECMCDHARMSRRKRDFDYLGRTVLVWVFCRTIQVSGSILQKQRCIVLDTDGRLVDLKLGCYLNRALLWGGCPPSLPRQLHCKS